jgi:SAM-dependent methyltransferase
MDPLRALLACPACAGTLAADWSCLACGAAFDAPDGIPNLRLPADDRTEAVRRFYGRAPFPGYDPRDTLQGLRQRAERNPFVRLLDRAIAPDARIVEVGCGTGQLSLYLARPGGTIVVGLYNRVARLPTRLRRVVVRYVPSAAILFDTVLRDRADQPARYAAWLRDQYQHPEEHRHTVAEVQRWFADDGVDYLRTYPSVVLDDEPDDLFTPAADDWRVEGWLAQLGWIWSLGREGGLFVTIGKTTGMPMTNDK